MGLSSWFYACTELNFELKSSCWPRGVLKVDIGRYLCASAQIICIKLSYGSNSMVRAEDIPVI